MLIYDEHFLVLGANVISPEKIQGGCSHVITTVTTNIELPND